MRGLRWSCALAPVCWAMLPSTGKPATSHCQKEDRFCFCLAALTRPNPNPPLTAFHRLPLHHSWWRLLLLALTVVVLNLKRLPILLVAYRHVHAVFFFLHHKAMIGNSKVVDLYSLATSNGPQRQRHVASAAGTTAACGCCLCTVQQYGSTCGTTSALVPIQAAAAPHLHPVGGRVL